MKTDIKTIAAFIAAVIWSDNEYQEAEKEAVKEVAEALDFSELEFLKVVEEELNVVKKLSAEKITDYIIDSAEKVDDDDIGIIMQAVMQVIISDNVLSYDEMNNLVAIAEALEIETPFLLLMLADLVKSEPELEIDFGNEE